MEFVFVAISFLLIGFLVGAGLTYFLVVRPKAAAGEFLRQNNLEMQLKNTSLEASIQAERANFNGQLLLLDQAKVTFTETLKALSNDALTQNSSSFLQLAGQNFNSVLVQMQEYKVALDNLEKSRAEQFNSLKGQVELITQAERELRSETSKLATALSSSQVRGRWGEIQLKRLVEMAGMLPHCDFHEQASLESSEVDEGSKRPDMIIRLPGGRQVVIDAKAVMGSYLQAANEEDMAIKKQHYQEHARKIKERAVLLGNKEYWSHLVGTPEFVVLFLPSEPLLSAAIEHDPELFYECAKKRVVLSTPSTLLALLYAVSYGWQQHAIAQDADKISELGRELHDRIATFAEAFSGVGKGLRSAVESYNSAVGSLETRGLVTARKLKDMGKGGGKEIPVLNGIETSPRNLSAVEFLADLIPPK